MPPKAPGAGARPGAKAKAGATAGSDAAPKKGGWGAHLQKNKAALGKRVQAKGEITAKGAKPGAKPASKAAAAASKPASSVASAQPLTRPPSFLSF